MYQIKSKLTILILGVILTVSCHGLEDLNVNPDKIGGENVDPNLLVPTVINGVGKTVVNLGFGDLAGVMQHTQKDGWSSGHNAYDWNNRSQSWAGYYQIMYNNKTLIQKAEDSNLDFHRAVGLIMKSYMFGLITDLWGDAPYTEALRGDEGPEYFDSEFDDQQTIYEGIQSDLKTANSLLSGSQSSYAGIDASQDILYGGDVAKWRKFANSISLRYYMRLSAKNPSWAEQGIKGIVNNPQQFPLILQASDDANMAYIGNTSSDAWPSNVNFDASPQGSYFRLKMGKPLVDKLQDLNDPRLGVWAAKIAVPIVLVSDAPDGTDNTVDGIRYVSQDIVDTYEDPVDGVGYPVDYDMEYVGYPPGMTFGMAYNLSKNTNQGATNLHASQLNEIYKEASGPLLQSRLISAAEVNLILAEAAFNGWIGGTAVQYYNEGVRQSLTAWGVGGDYTSYISGPAAFTGYADIINQKWIASWTAASESWFDYRRTGLPDLQSGPASKRQALPLRFYYNIDEIDNNPNVETAIDQLEPTPFKGDDASNNSAWSKMWLLQGTGEPY
ncbi:SusD/RagB family nutrient-binding outer membrane lipoprotein [Arenibacter echinorum]|uniref:SusD-like starch-binding protein associating with outer membrane n=1 Tax=Arenibacter echinorum TaxID=440515 RepID=A0A327R1W2_9FLAO|nr:SusD/RagB family nutrient-binding outer membrane lipoprotein [Arenibacter echinorum]RAJ09962.1 SusD-like starch-binding protein associating with outer membrane [Arenibacter echinorum]